MASVIDCPVTPDHNDQCPATPDTTVQIKSPTESTSTNSDNEETVGQTPATASPPPNCAICLGKCKNKCFTDSCLHQFCFKCLLEWSKVKAECPLCKQSFKSIIHNVKSIDQFEEYLVQPNPPEFSSTGSLRGQHLNILPRRNLVSSNLRNASGFSATVQIRNNNGFFLNSADLIAEMRQRYPSDDLENLTELWRSYIYINGLYALPVPDVTGRFRECSARFYRENPAQVHRIMPFLNRELLTLFRGSVHSVSFVLRTISNLITMLNMNSPEFRRRIQTYLYNMTSHFIHELMNFARSPFDMIGYDREVQYSQNYEAIVVNTTSDDSDSEVVSIAQVAERIRLGRRNGMGFTIETRSGNDSTLRITVGNNDNNTNNSSASTSQTTAINLTTTSPNNSSTSTSNSNNNNNNNNNVDNNVDNNSNTTNAENRNNNDTNTNNNVDINNTNSNNNNNSNNYRSNPLHNRSANNNNSSYNNSTVILGLSLSDIIDAVTNDNMAYPEWQPPQVLGETQVIEIEHNSGGNSSGRNNTVGPTSFTDVTLSSSGSDDDIEFVMAQKPPHLRTPEYVSLNSDSDSDVVFLGETKPEILQPLLQQSKSIPSTGRGRKRNSAGIYIPIVPKPSQGNIENEKSRKSTRKLESQKVKHEYNQGASTSAGIRISRNNAGNYKVGTTTRSEAMRHKTIYESSSTNSDEENSDDSSYNSVTSLSSSYTNSKSSSRSSSSSSSSSCIRNCKKNRKSYQIHSRKRRRTKDTKLKADKKTPRKRQTKTKRKTYRKKKSSTDLKSNISNKKTAKKQMRRKRSLPQETSPTKTKLVKHFKKDFSTSFSDSSDSSSESFLAYLRKLSSSRTSNRFIDNTNT